jgi:4-cresol dehydrogenase (hydroxylating)
VSEGADRAYEERLAAALAEWCARLGDGHVLRGDAALARWLQTTLPSAHAPVAVLRPADRAAVAAGVMIADRHRIPLYPVSTGRNWGYGDARPSGPGQVILDLSRLNRIVEVNRELAYAVVEPGVTQGQLAELLEREDTGLWLDCTGAGPDTSIVGNVLERGFGHTAYGNRFQNIAGMEIVLADGSVLRTGFGHYANAQATRVYPQGIGPVLDGLFTQSNFGVVTQLGLWLQPKPEHVEMFFCELADDGDVAPAVDTLRRLRLEGTLRSVVHIANDMRMASSRPSAAGAMPPAPLDGPARAAFRARERVAAWSLSGSLAGPRPQVRAAAAALRKALRAPGRRLRILGLGKLALLDAATRLAPGGAAARFRPLVAAARAVADLNTGRPTGYFLSGAYWARRQGVPASFPDDLDPARDRCGLLWLSPVVPMTGAAVLDLLAVVEPIYREHGFHPLLTLSTVTDRALGAVMTIAYDRDDPAQPDRAQVCYDALWGALTARGYFSYRVGVQAMTRLGTGSEAFWDVVARLKGALDPAGVIAPGRYQPVRPFD